MNPIVYGDYPETMKKLAGKKMPRFFKNQSELLIGSFDFIGVNYYATLYVKDNPSNRSLDERDFASDQFAKLGGFYH